MDPHRLSSCTKGCSDWWSRHVPSKFKSNNINSLSYLWERVSSCVSIPCLCFLEGLYRVDDTTTVVCWLGTLTFFCNVLRAAGQSSQLRAVGMCYLLTCHDPRPCSCLSPQFFRHLELCVTINWHELCGRNGVPSTSQMLVWMIMHVIGP